MWMFLIPLAVLLATFLILRKRIPRLGASSVAIVIATTGFAGMAYNMVLILAFQSLYGNIYQMIALLIAAFMVGLAIGGIFITHIMSRITNGKSILVKLELLVLVYSILVPVVLILFPSNLGQTAIFVAIQAAIIILSLTSGILVGSEFPLANKIRLRDTESVGEVAGGLYACDLMGAWFGALIVGVWLIPVLGIVSTCILIACLKVVSLVLVATSRL